MHRTNKRTAVCCAKVAASVGRRTTATTTTTPSSASPLPSSWAASAAAAIVTASRRPSCLAVLFLFSGRTVLLTAAAYGPVVGRTYPSRATTTTARSAISGTTAVRSTISGTTASMMGDSTRKNSGGSSNDEDNSLDTTSSTTTVSLSAFLDNSRAHAAMIGQREEKGGTMMTISDTTAAAAIVAAALIPPPTSPTIFHVFSGNEACDADSICSAVCMAFLMAGSATGKASATNSAAAAAAAAGGCRADVDGTAALDGAVVDPLRDGEGDSSRSADGGVGGQEGGGGAGTSATAAPAVVYVPVMPIPRADLALRREVLVLFELCGVDPSLVTFIDDIDLPGLLAEGKLRLTLMDHNAVSGSLSGLGDAVVEIVDHHADLGEHGNVQGLSRDIAFDSGGGNGKPLVGSCCTLVAERMLIHAPWLLSSNVARLLLGVILIDTVNLDTDAKRATPRDVAAAEELSRRVSWSSAKPAVEVKISENSDSAAGARTSDKLSVDAKDPLASPYALFDALRNAKFDPAFWKDLSAQDCLRYDYKQFTPGSGGGTGSGTDSASDANNVKTAAKPLEFGMSSMLCRAESLADKRGAREAVRDFALARGIDSLVVMTVTLDGDDKMSKELLVFADSEERLREMEAFLEGPSGEDLRLRPVLEADRGEFRSKEGGEGRVLWWEMGNVRPSRKQIAPSVASFYKILASKL